MVKKTIKGRFEINIPEFTPKVVEAAKRIKNATGDYEGFRDDAVLVSKALLYVRDQLDATAQNLQNMQLFRNFVENKAKSERARDKK